MLRMDNVKVAFSLHENQDQFSILGLLDCTNIAPIVCVSYAQAHMVSRLLVR